MTTTEIARTAIIGELTRIVAKAYGALLDARNSGCGLKSIDDAIEEIENWRQTRDPDAGKGQRAA